MRPNIFWTANRGRPRRDPAHHGGPAPGHAEHCPHRHAFFRQDHAGQTAGKAAGPHLRGSGRRDRQGRRRSIPDIFAAEGEDGFRAKETEQTARFGKENRQLLSCGGGVVKRPENLRALHQNGVVLFIDRPVEALAVGGSRPLSSSMEALRTMEAPAPPAVPGRR